jgi:hypothetical protein
LSGGWGGRSFGRVGERRQGVCWPVEEALPGRPSRWVELKGARGV